MSNPRVQYRPRQAPQPVIACAHNKFKWREWTESKLSVSIYGGFLWLNQLDYVLELFK